MFFAKPYILLALIPVSIVASVFLMRSGNNTLNMVPIHRKESENLQNSYISPISIDFLRQIDIDSPGPVIESQLPDGTNYSRSIAYYESEGNKVYGLLTVPNSEAPEGGFPAIIFNHGYIPPAQYQTESNYIAYVDFLSRNGFVVFKIDYRGNGRSEGDPSGTYFSSAYTIDAISALKSLQKYEYVNPERIGMWGHSMAGNLLLRAMLISDEIEAGVIWSGAVYSYEDFAKYRINDTSYTHRPHSERAGQSQMNREVSDEIQKIRSSIDDVDFNNDFWSSISLTTNINYLKNPLQLHHATNDPVVDIGYSRDLADVLEESSKDYEFYEYEGGGHNINSPYFEEAMQRTVDFFNKHL